MRRCGFLILLLFLGCAIAESDALAQDGKPVRLRIATAGLGGSWYVYGAAIADILKAQLPKGSSVDVLPLAGGIGNPRLIEKGDAELALGHNVSAAWASKGEVAYDKRLGKVRALVGGLDVFFMGIFTAERSELTSMQRVQQQSRPLRLLTVPVGGVGEVGARHVLEAYGLSYDKIKATGGSVRFAERAATVSAFQDGNADIWMHVVNYGHPIVTELSTVTRIHMLSLSEEAVSKLSAKGWARFVVPENSFKGQMKSVLTVAAPTNLLATADLPESIAFLITKLISENKASLVRAHAAFRDFNPATAWEPQVAGAPLHPGAERYYREKGLMK